jgi:6-pyruvoyltetrahydropterin/6-carboxytetrahydropterin synthase
MTRTPHRLFLGKDQHKFNAAHMTVFPDGTKERLHGHNFHVTVAIDLRDVSFEALLDFGVVKRAVEECCAAWNERLILAERCPFFRIVRREAGELEFTLCGRRYVVPEDEVVLLPVDNVVCETLSMAAADALLARLGHALRPGIAAGIEVGVTESLGQGATYYRPLDP